MLHRVCQQLHVTLRDCDRVIHVAVKESNICRSFTPSAGHIGTTAQKSMANSQRVEHPSEMMQLGERRPPPHPASTQKKIVSEKRQEYLELSILNHFLH